MDDVKKIMFIREYEGTKSSMLNVIADCTKITPLNWSVSKIDDISEEVGDLLLFNVRENLYIKVKPGNHVLIYVDDDDDKVIKIIDDKKLAKKIERQIVMEYILEGNEENGSAIMDDKLIDLIVDKICGEQDEDDGELVHDPGFEKCYECEDIKLCLGVLVSLGKYDEASDILDILKKKEG